MSTLLWLGVRTLLRRGYPASKFFIVGALVNRERPKLLTEPVEAADRRQIWIKPQAPVW